MNKFEKLSRSEMKNLLGGSAPPPGDCEDACGPLKSCPTNSPFCLSSSCTNRDGKSVQIKSCSPTQEF